MEGTIIDDLSFDQEGTDELTPEEFEKTLDFELMELIEDKEGELWIN